MSRRRIEIPDSLELLLDTICNTFGAVIFISMLLSILAGEKASEASTQTSDEQIDQMETQLKKDITKARARHTQLKTQLNQQSELLKKFSNPASLQMAMEISQASQTQLQVLNTKSEQIETLTEQDAESLRKEGMLSQQLQKRDELDRQVKAITRELDAATAQAGRKAKVSRVRPTSKTGFGYMLHDSKLYRTVNAEGKIDAHDCSELDRAGSHVLLPRPTGGIAMPTEQNRVESRFEHLDNKRHFVRLFVSPNSFGQFVAVKDALVSLNLEYEVIIFNDNKAELFLSSDPIESFVQ